ncbi:MAG: Hsp20/alpha crystallin family protein [Ignavibacteriales bacterium]|nr:Hsp20/alpha crystallin family protein [Ignavibacteriales bacterium]
MEDKDLVNVEESKTTNWDEALEKECWIAPIVDIFETEEDFTLIANMPGVKKENVKIKIEDNSLLVMGKVDYENMLNRNYVLNESQAGNFYRKFQISESIDDSKIAAKLENGQLNIHLPKHERAKPKNIEIK